MVCDTLFFVDIYDTWQKKRTRPGILTGFSDWSGCHEILKLFGTCKGHEHDNSIRAGPICFCCSAIYFPQVEPLQKGPNATPCCQGAEDRRVDISFGHRVGMATAQPERATV